MTKIHRSQATSTNSDHQEKLSIQQHFFQHQIVKSPLEIMDTNTNNTLSDAQNECLNGHVTHHK